MFPYAHRVRHRSASAPTDRPDAHRRERGRRAVPMWKRIAAVVLPLLALFAAPLPVDAAPREARVALHEGKLRTADLTAALSRELNLPECSLDCGEIDLRG